MGVDIIQNCEVKGIKRNGDSVEGLETRIIDKDVTTGEGEVPVQVKAAINSATQLPSLSVLSGDKVISTQPLPPTFDGILEAVR